MLQSRVGAQLGAALEVDPAGYRVVVVMSVIGVAVCSTNKTSSHRVYPESPGRVYGREYAVTI